MKLPIKTISILLLALSCFISSQSFALPISPADDPGDVGIPDNPPPPGNPAPAPIGNAPAPDPAANPQLGPLQDNGQALNLNIPAPGCAPQAACLPTAPASVTIEDLELSPPVPVNPTYTNGGRVAGQQMSMSLSTPSFTDIPIMNGNVRTTQDALSIKVVATCFPTNLRVVANPVALNGRIQMRGLYSASNVGVDNKRFYIEFPAKAVMMDGIANPSPIPLVAGVPMAPIVTQNKSPKSFSEFIAKVKTEFIHKSKRTISGFLPQQALALMDFEDPYDSGGDGSGGGEPPIVLPGNNGGVGGLGGVGINPLTTALNPISPMAYHMWFEGLTGITPIGSISQRQVLVQIPGASQTVNAGSDTVDAAMSQFSISNIGFIQDVPRPTAAEMAEITSWQNYQIAASTYYAWTGRPYWISYVDWRRTLYSGMHMGYTGPVGQPLNGGPQPAISINQSVDGKTIEIFASLPGEISMCGGFYSPLMVFFEKKYPSFENVSAFKMMHQHKTYWPKANHEGYFIGLLNKNKKIESHHDLFGESEDIRHGFDKLAQYDLNKDGVIDQKDPVFKKLVLWKDKKGMGQFDKKDSIALSQKIKSINLKYKNQFEMVGIGAEFRQRADFTYVSKGKVKKGEVIDVWLKPYLGENRAVAGK